MLSNVTMQDPSIIGAFDSYGGFGPRMGLSRQDILERAFLLNLIDKDMFHTYKTYFQLYPEDGKFVYEPVKRIVDVKISQPKRRY